MALESAVGDGFSGPSLNSSLWASGTWNGGSYTPSFSSGAIQVSSTSGAFIRSQGTFATRVLEGEATFGAGAWQHLGFGGLNFADGRYLFFSTFNTSNTLFARSNSGSGEVQTNLGAIPSGRHTYRIEWAPGRHAGSGALLHRWHAAGHPHGRQHPGALYLRLLQQRQRPGARARQPAPDRPALRRQRQLHLLRPGHRQRGTPGSG